MEFRYFTESITTRCAFQAFKCDSFVSYSLHFIERIRHEVLIFYLTQEEKSQSSNMGINRYNIL